MIVLSISRAKGVKWQERMAETKPDLDDNQQWRLYYYVKPRVTYISLSHFILIFHTWIIHEATND